jgi:hypothetical protein
MCARPRLESVPWACPSYFLVAVFLKYGLGIPTLFDPIDPVVTHPVAEAVVVFGPAVALMASALAILRVQF